MTTDSASTDLLFVDAPPPANPRGRKSPITPWLAALREHPDQWSKFPDDCSAGCITTIRKGRGYGVKFPGEFEVRGVMAGAKHRVFVYARYVGVES